MLVRAPAKINLYLKILGKREDGYHNIYTIMQKVSLYDIIELQFIKKNRIIVETDCADIPCGENNLAFKAASIFFAHLGEEKGIKIFIKKRIPSGAGLGGGSSDAGAVLRALNKLLGAGFNRVEMLKLAEKVGSDVPFFVHPCKSAIVEGRGELLTPIALEEKWYLLVKPPFSISTAWAYESFDKLKIVLTKHVKSFKIFNLNKRDFLKRFTNDLEKVCMKEFPVLKEIKKRLMASGALNAVMSGSGSTMIGIYNSRDEALHGAKIMPDNYWIKIVKGL